MIKKRSHYIPLIVKKTVTVEEVPTVGSVLTGCTRSRPYA